MIINMFNYKNTLEDAKNFYTNCAHGNADEAGKCLDNYFYKAGGMNPCAARMALQQAQTDIYAKLRIDLANGDITKDEFTTSYKNIVKGTFEVNHDPALSELENRIKVQFPKTWKKRLSIIPGLTDNEYTGLSNVKTGKGLKRFQYILRKLIK